jgi:hypothetical protein
MCSTQSAVSDKSNNAGKTEQTFFHSKDIIACQRTNIQMVQKLLLI